MTVREIREIYDEASCSWTGLDWDIDLPTGRVGCPALAEAEEAAEAAREAGDVEAAEAWDRVADLIRRVERDAALAEEAAEAAMDAIEYGDWEVALTKAREAAGLEQGYGDARTWGRFLTAIEEMADDR